MKAGEPTEKEAEAMTVTFRKEAGEMTRKQAAGRIEAYKKSIDRGMRNNQTLRPHRPVMQ